MKKLTSVQNPRIKAAVRLKSSRGRKTQNRIIVFGAREVLRALQSGIVPVELFLSTELLNESEATALLDAWPASLPVFDLPATVMDKLRYGERREGAVLVAQRPAWSIASLRPKGSGGDPFLIVILERIEKPGNIGAVLRSVDGAGASAVLLADPQCDVLHPNCIRASMSSIFAIPIAVTTAREALAWCLDRGLRIYSLMDTGSVGWSDVDWKAPAAMVLGNEESGLSPLWRQTPCVPISIPMHGISDSLNLSVAAAIALYEARRQRLAR